MPPRPVLNLSHHELTDQDILNVIAIASRESRKQKRWKSAAAKTPEDGARFAVGENNEHSQPKGKLIWEYSSQAVSPQAANGKPRQITPGIMPQGAREEVASKSINNINPLKINIKSDIEKNPQTPENANGESRKRKRGKSAAAKTMEDGARFAVRDFSDDVRAQEVKKLTAFNNTFLKVLNDFENGILPRDKVIELEKTPEALTMLNVANLPISLSASVLYQIQRKARTLC